MAERRFPLSFRFTGRGWVSRGVPGAARARHQFHPFQPKSDI